MAKGLTDLQAKFLELLMALPSGESMTGAELARRTEMVQGKNSVALAADARAVVGALRRKNYPICAGAEGYYYARTDLQLSSYIVEFEGRISSQQEACDGLKESFHNIGKSKIEESEKEIIIKI